MKVIKKIMFEGTEEWIRGEVERTYPNGEVKLSIGVKESGGERIFIEDITDIKKVN